jgi:GTP pyrophosphokinase
VRLSDRFGDALGYAFELHAAQERKADGTPYVLHLLAVCSLVLEAGGTEDQAIGALLHDAVEDQGGRPRLEEIRRRFGDAVAGIVEGCTDADRVPKPPWRERKERYLAHLPDAPPAVLLVSCADKLHNARSLARAYRREGEGVWGHFRGGRDGLLWYYRSLVEAYRRAGGVPLLDELTRAVADLEALVGEA